MQKLIFYLFFSIAFTCISQNKESVYLLLDENNNTIDFETYKKKCNSFLYDCKLIDRDSIQVYAMQQNYEFGKLKEYESNQIRNLISNISGENYDDNKSLIIYLKDTIVGFSYYYDRSLFQRKKMDSMFPKRSYFKNSESDLKYRYYSKRKRYDTNQKKCKKQFDKYSVEIIYFYNRNFEYDYKPKNHTFYKIPLSLKKVLFKNNDTGYAILKPNGNYFFYNNLNEKKLKELLKNDWQEYITEYNSIKESLPKKADKGFFKNIEHVYIPFPKYQCYCKTYSEY